MMRLGTDSLEFDCRTELLRARTEIRATDTDTTLGWELLTDDVKRFVPAASHSISSSMRTPNPTTRPSPAARWTF